MPEPTTPVTEVRPVELYEDDGETIGLTGAHSVTLYPSTSDPSSGDIYIYSHGRSTRYRVHGGEDRLRVALAEADIERDFEGWSRLTDGPNAFRVVMRGSAWLGGRRPGVGRSRSNRESPMATLNRRWRTNVYVLGAEVNSEGAFLDLSYVRAADVPAVLEGRMGLQTTEYEPVYYRACERYFVLLPDEARKLALGVGGIERSGRHREAAKSYLAKMEIPITYKQWARAICEMTIYRIGPGSTAPYRVEVALRGNRQNGQVVPADELAAVVKQLDAILLGYIDHYDLHPVPKPTKWEPLLPTRAGLAPRDICVRRMRPSGWRGERVPQGDRTLAWSCHTLDAPVEEPSVWDDEGIGAATRISRASEVFIREIALPQQDRVAEQDVARAVGVDEVAQDGEVATLPSSVLDEVGQTARDGLGTPDEARDGDPDARSAQAFEVVPALETSDSTTYRSSNAPSFLEAPSARHPVFSRGCPYLPVVDEIQRFGGLTEVIFSPYRDPGRFVERVLQRFPGRVGVAVLAPDPSDIYPHARRLASEHPLGHENDVVVVLVDATAAALVANGFLVGAEEGPPALFIPGPFSQDRGSFRDPDGTSAWWRALAGLMADYTEQLREACERTGARVILVTQDARPVRGRGAWWKSHESRDTRVRSILGNATRRSCHQRFYVAAGRGEEVQQISLWKDELEGLVGRIVYQNLRRPPPWRARRRSRRPDPSSERDGEVSVEAVDEYDEARLQLLLDELQAGGAPVDEQPR